jgi:hypothetical protein
VLLRSLREGIDYSTATGRMLAGIFAAWPPTHATSSTNARAALIRGAAARVAFPDISR